MSDPTIETFKFIKEVPLADCDGKPIRVGSVLRNIEDSTQGVVTCVLREGMKPEEIPMVFLVPSIGDIVIQVSAGVRRVTNCYGNWKHVPDEEVTYQQRFTVWCVTKYEHDDSRNISRDEGLAIDGIMALLPPDTVDWERGPWADTLEDALGFLVQHLTELSESK